MGRVKGGANNDFAMSLKDIAKQLHLTERTVRADYESALRKLRASYAAVDLIIDLSEYHWQLRAKSAECQDAIYYHGAPRVRLASSRAYL